ncbi:MAG TPA: glycosyltransferase family 4 protein [Solirubrobacterales bacterium]|nr:glycosyltransferase family 4 protein [Solirubrobacterales bacterium]
MSVADGGRRALLISENESVPHDRRVWNEARTLSEAGWEVSVACPADEYGPPGHETRAGVAIHRFPLRMATGALDYAREYGEAMLRLRALVGRLSRERPVDVVHTANPPDFLLWSAYAARRRGAAFVFDHHDLMPELFRARFGRAGLPYKGLRAIERRALRGADVVISTNESYKRLAIERAGVDPDDVFVVRNGPDLESFTPVDPDPDLRADRRFLLAYLGVMEPQDGVDQALLALAALRERRGADWRAIFVGEGSVRGDMEGLAAELGIADSVEFAGWCGDADIRRILSSADLCLAPDPPSPLNDVSTMMKVPEYMAMGAPIASFDLAETRVSAGEAAAYAEPSPGALGELVDELLNDEERRRRMARIALERVTELSWQRSSERLLAAYERAVVNRRGR